MAVGLVPLEIGGEGLWWIQHSCLKLSQPRWRSVAARIHLVCPTLASEAVGSGLVRPTFNPRPGQQVEVAMGVLAPQDVRAASCPETFRLWWANFDQQQHSALVRMVRR